MDEDAFNLSIRKFLKHFGVTAQREIESAVRKAIEQKKLRGDESIPVRATLQVDGILRDFHIDGTITLAATADAPPAPAP
jgi:ribosomal protein L1